MRALLVLATLTGAVGLLAGCSGGHRSAPRLDPQHLPPLPHEVLAVQRGGGVALLRLDGSAIGTLHGFRAGMFGLSRGGRSYTYHRGLSRLVEPPAVAIDYFFSTPADLVCGPLGEGTSTYASCYDRRSAVLPGSLGVFRAGRLTERALVPAATRERAGHWTAAHESPDGKRLLLEWGGRCDASSAYLAPASGGVPRPVLRDRAAKSVALGWAHDGRALVLVPANECGVHAAAPGVYSVGRHMKLKLVAPGADAALLHP